MTLTMRRNYGLVLPKNYVYIEKDEMEYFDGGLYISYDKINNVVDFISFTNKSKNMTVGALAAALAPAIPVAFSWVNALPIVGQVVFCYIVAQSLSVATMCAIAYCKKKGVEISPKWYGMKMTIK